MNNNNNNSQQPWFITAHRWFQWLPEQLGKVIAILCLLLVLDIFFVVILRYLFDQPSVMLQEAGMWMHSSIFLLGAAYTLAADEHVRVDIFYRGASPVYRAWVDIVGTLLLLFPVCAYLFINSLNYVALSWKIAETSAEVGGLPALYLLKTLLLIMPLLLALQGLAIIFKNIAVLKNTSAKTISEVGK